MLPQSFLDKLETLPVQSGCYLFKDKKGRSSTSARPRACARASAATFNSLGGRAVFHPRPAANGRRLRDRVTATEKEAAILEDSLIKEHRPRYNVKLRTTKAISVSASRSTTIGLGSSRFGARSRRGSLFWPVPLGDGRPTHSTPRQQALSATHLLRPGAHVPQAAVPAVSNSPLPRSLRL